MFCLQSKGQRSLHVLGGEWQQSRLGGQSEWFRGQASGAGENHVHHWGDQEQVSHTDASCLYYLSIFLQELRHNTVRALVCIY